MFWLGCIVMAIIAIGLVFAYVKRDTVETWFKVKSKDAIDTTERAIKSKLNGE